MHQSKSYLNFVCKVIGFKVLLVDDPKPTLKPDVKLVDILKIIMYI